jgi:tRNA(fMet)-specific endonuclease VapC
MRPGGPGAGIGLRPAYDAMIAAIAVANELPLFTCNPVDFAGIEGLTVVAVAHPEGPPDGR